MKDLLLRLGEKMVGKAVERGASEAEFYGVVDDLIQLEISRNSIEKVVSRRTGRYGLRLVAGKKLAIYVSEDLGGGAVGSIIDKALEIARARPEDPRWPGLARGYREGGNVRVYDEALDEVGIEGMLDLVAEAINTSLRAAEESGAEKTRVTRGYAWIVKGTVVLVNSYGDHIHGSGTQIVIDYNVHVEKDGYESSYPFVYMARTLDKRLIIEKARRAGEYALKFLNPKTLPSGEYKLLLTPEIHGELVSTVFSPAVSAYNIQRNRSPLKDKLGEKIASEEVTVMDDPYMDYGFGSRGFDDEGMPTTTKPIVDKGVFTNIVYDHYTASIEGKETTGNAYRRSLSVNPQPYPLNIVFKPRNPWSLDEMIGEIDRGVIVYGVIGAWMSNPVNGNIQATITHGLYVENGEIKYPVKGLVIGGNYYDYLSEKLVALGKDTENYENIYTVPILVNRVPLAGR